MGKNREPPPHHRLKDDGEQVGVCERCGAEASTDSPRLAWIPSKENDQAVCVDCYRKERGDKAEEELLEHRMRLREELLREADRILKPTAPGRHLPKGIIDDPDPTGND